MTDCKRCKRKDGEIETLREMLWLNHGHERSGQYGDDGEMHCSQCWQEYGFWDWKHTPIDEIIRKIEEGNLRKIMGLSLWDDPGSVVEPDPEIIKLADDLVGDF